MAVGVAAEVKSKLSVVDVVGQTVQLKKSGSTYKGLCPFHGEKTPSFYVTPARESWKCFGCGLGGDIFSFVMQRDSVSFPEALKVLAARAGVELDERTSREDARKRRLRDVLDGAIAFYHTVLTAHPSGPAGARLPARPRLHRRDDRGLPARLGAGRLGDDLEAAHRQARRDPGGAGGGRPDDAARHGTGRRLRPVPGADHLPDPGHERQRDRARRPLPRRRGRHPRPRPEVPQLAGHAALRQEPDAVPRRQGEGPDPQVRPGGHRRGLHRRADGPPGRLRQRRRQPRDGAHPGPGRAAQPLRQEGRPGLRRRPGRAVGRHVRGDRAEQPDLRGPGRGRRRA